MIKIANISEIPIGGSKVVMYDEMPVALFNINGNRCWIPCRLTWHRRGRCISAVPVFWLFLARV